MLRIISRKARSVIGRSVGASASAAPAALVALERLENRALLSTIAGGGQHIMTSVAQQSASAVRSASQSAKSASDAASQQAEQQSGEHTDEIQNDSSDQSDGQIGNAGDQ